MNDKMRKEFDEAFRKRFGFGRMTASANADAGQMLKAAEWAWQASRECMAITIPIASAYPANEAASEADYYFDQGQADGLSKARVAIHAAGLKTK